MKAPPYKTVSRRVILNAATAADLLTLNPVSISADATVKDAAVLFAEKGYSAAPVIDEAGRPIGVVSQADIVVHDREQVAYPSVQPEYFASEDLRSLSRESVPTGFGVVDVDRTQMRDIMTPVVFSVVPETDAHKVIDDILSQRVHRLFVIDTGGVLVGVISAIDILRCLRIE